MIQVFKKSWDVDRMEEEMGCKYVKACILLGKLPTISVGHPDHKREWKLLHSCSYYITAHTQFSNGVPGT